MPEKSTSGGKNRRWVKNELRQHGEGNGVSCKLSSHLYDSCAFVLLSTPRDGARLWDMGARHPAGVTRVAPPPSPSPACHSRFTKSSLSQGKGPSVQPPTPLRGLYSLCLKCAPDLVLQHHCWDCGGLPSIPPSLHPPRCYMQGARRHDTCCLKTRLGEEKERESSPKGKAISRNKISTTTHFLTFSTVVS